LQVCPQVVIIEAIRDFQAQLIAEQTDTNPAAELVMTRDEEREKTFISRLGG
jgi:hypothetical protein